MLVLLAMLAVLVAVSFPAIRIMIAKARLESTVQQTATVMQAARLQAIRQATSSQVALMASGDQTWIQASIDRNRDDDFESDLGFVQIHPVVQIAGPAADLAGVVGWTDDVLQFNSDGTAAEAGAVRISAQVGGDVVYYEVRVSPVAAPRISVREWDPLASKWVEEGDD